MIGWVLSALGVLFGLCVAITLAFTGQPLLYVVVAALPSAIAIRMVINDLRYPRINDVATNVEEPPAFVGGVHAPSNQSRDMSFPEKNGAIIRTAYPHVQPLELDETPEQAFQLVSALASDMPGWVITHRDPDALILEAEVSTYYFRFIDDVIICVSSQGGRTRIDMRSKSRDGLVDAGANAKRIQTFLGQLKSQQSSESESQTSST